MNAEDVIGILSIINGLLVVLVGWLLRQQTKMSDRIDALTTQVTVIRHELSPEGDRSLLPAVQLGVGWQRRQGLGLTLKTRPSGRSSMNPLENNPKARKVAYKILQTLGLALGATQTAFLAVDAGQPTWLSVCLTVLGYVSAAIGFTADKNVAQPDPKK